MKKFVIGLMFLALPTSAYASSASSTVINNVNTSSSTSNSQVTSHTEITTETNGKVTHYTSDEPNKSIHVESNDDGSKIEVNGQEVSGNGDQDGSPTVAKSPSPTRVRMNGQATANEKNFLQKLFDELEHPFKIFFLKFHKS